MPDYGDIALGLIGGLQKGIGSYYDQKRDLNRSALEAKSKGLILNEDEQYVDDPAAVARRKAEQNLKIRMDLAEKGQEPIFDDNGDFQSAKYRDDHLAMLKAKEAGNPFTKMLQQQSMQKNSMEMQDRADKKKEADLSLQTKYGKANTLEDAKAVKEAEEARAGLASLTDQMIDLRKNNAGLGRFSPEANARGQQLSKQALLLKKKLDGLGVLSQSDMEIVNAIVPEDPNAINWAGFVGGGDPTMEKLQSFKKDTSDKMNSVVANRIRGGGGGLLNAQSGQSTGGDGLLTSSAGAKEGFPRQMSDSKGRTATVNSAKELQEAMSEGFK